jgi:hypothetical protein
MHIRITLLLCTTLILTTLSANCQPGKHLFILSGQSNMAGLNPEESFIPTIETALGKGNVIIVKDAMGAQPIRRWYKDWKPLHGDSPAAQPDLYDSLMKKTRAAIADQRIETITFIWMQGERDAREKMGDVYEKSLLGLYHQLSNDLKRNDVNFIIGRLSDYDMTNSTYPHWMMIREIQVRVGESNPRYGWVNTDDLNDGYDRAGKAIQNDLHMSGNGYIVMGKRFAEKATQLISSNKK